MLKVCQNLQLANQDGTHIRRLLKDVPVDGQQQRYASYYLKRQIISLLPAEKLGYSGISH